MQESRQTRIIIKHSSVAGRIPTGTTAYEETFIREGELAINTADKKLFSFDGTNVFQLNKEFTGGTVSSLSASSLSADTIFLAGTDITTMLGGGSTSAVNIGSGEAQIFKQKTGSDLELRSLSAGTGISIQTGDTITISTNASASPVQLFFTFYKSDGTQDDINLTTDYKLPFYVSSGTAKNIPMTT
jgi:hypothetical protein